MYSILASVVVATHLGFVLFVLIGGLGLAHVPWIVWVHIPAVIYAILIQTIGWRCPLTDLEKWLRQLAGQAPYPGEFLPHYVWSHFRMTGTEPIIAVGLIGLILLVNLKPYLSWATG